MARWRWLVAVVGLLAVVAIAALVASRPADPLTVVRGWVAARNAGDVDGLMSYFGETGNILGIGVHLPGGREELRAIFEAQAAAGLMIEQSGCTVDGRDCHLSLPHD